VILDQDPIDLESVSFCASSQAKLREGRPVAGLFEAALHDQRLSTLYMIAERATAFLSPTTGSHGAAIMQFLPP
jgi:hypothetical protein